MHLVNVWSTVLILARPQLHDLRQEKIDCLRDACPELSRVVSMAHFLRMIGNNSAHTGRACHARFHGLCRMS